MSQFVEAPVDSPASSPTSNDLHNPATASVLERRPRTLKDGNTFAVFDHYGDIVGTPHSPVGLYHKDTRHLSHFELLLNGSRMLLLSSTVQHDNAVLSVDLANPDVFSDNALVMSREMLHVTRAKYLWNGRCHERIGIFNFDQSSHQLRFTLRFAVDFADLFEVRGVHRERHGTSRIEHPSDSAILFRYQGLDNKERTTRIDFEPKPNSLNDKEAVFNLSLAPHERASLFVTVQCDIDQPVRKQDFFSNIRKARRGLLRAVGHAATIETSNAVFNRALSRSMADLYMLISETPQGLYPFAGIPWFSTPFGRDGIITAMQMLWIDPTVAKGVLKFLAATQATEEDVQYEAEPGKILHETRSGEMACLGEVPYSRYYGSIDSTPLFVFLAGKYFERTGDRETIQNLWPNIEAALKWIDLYGDRDHDGFVEYQARGQNGLANQGWKDSYDSVSHNDGRLAEGSIALCEVQGYVYAAKIEGAKLCRALGNERMASMLEQQAQSLQARFEAAFWCDDLGTYVIALDGDKRQCRVRSSNAGHALFTGIASQAHAERVMLTLFSRECYSGWGIRTLAATEYRYNPMSYHNGSVWPHDNALIAIGLARYGMKEAALRAFQSFFDAIQFMDHLRPPELFCGFKRRRNKAPTLYPVACSPQAWASAAIFTFLEACLGLQCNYSGNEIRFEKPVLPVFVNDMHIHKLKLGQSCVDILLRRYGSSVAVNVTSQRGDARIIVAN